MNAQSTAQSDRAQRRADRLELLQQAAHALVRSLDEQTIARELARQVERLVACDGVAIVLIGKDGSPHHAVRRASGEETAASAGGHCDALVQGVAQQREPVRLDHAKPEEEGAETRQSSLLGVPALSGNSLIAVIALWSSAPGAFTPEDLELLLAVGAHAASALSNARLFEEHRALGERYRRVLETTSDAIVITNRERRITFANPAADELFGVRASVSEIPVVSLIPPEMQQLVADREERAFAGEPQRYDIPIARADGDHRIASVATAPLRDADRVVGIVASLRDVTDERIRAVALERSEARYLRLLESASDAIFTVDEAGQLTSVNRALERAVGHRRQELLGSSLADLLDERDRSGVAELLSATLAGRRQRAELRYPSATGETRSCSMTATPIIVDGRVTGALGIVRDVTDEKRLTEQLFQQEKLAAVGQLVSGVAHELNNPLAGVMAFSELLLAGESPDPDHRHALEVIHQEARRAARIVSNLLTFARQHQPERTVTDLNRVVLDTLDLRRYALRTAQITVEERLDPLLPHTWADPFQLQQVILNLLTNAEQAMEGWSGERRITVATGRSGATLHIRVTDTGPGIPTEDVSRVFNPFFTTKPVGQGTGLGLSISDGIIREHDGRIRVESQPTTGTRFTIELPYTMPSAPAVPETAATDALDSVPRRLLIVDDEPAIRNALATYLRSLGHTVDIATGGAEALERAAAEHYDSVVLDLRMPDLSGDAVFQSLCETAPALAARVVFLTGDMQSDAARTFLNATGRPALTKPFLLEEVAAVLLEAARH